MALQKVIFPTVALFVSTAFVAIFKNLGEFVKIGFTIAILGMAYRWIPDVSGAGLMAGFIFALKAPLVVFFLTFILERKNGLQF